MFFEPRFVVGPQVFGVEVAQSSVGFGGEKILIHCWVLEYWQWRWDPKESEAQPWIFVFIDGDEDCDGMGLVLEEDKEWEASGKKTEKEGIVGEEGQR